MSSVGKDRICFDIIDGQPDGGGEPKLENDQIMHLNYLDLIGIDYIDASCSSSPAQVQQELQCDDDDPIISDVLLDQSVQRTESRETRSKRSSSHVANVNTEKGKLVEENHGRSKANEDKIATIANLTKWGYLR
jgi:hypothetical protein